MEFDSAATIWSSQPQRASRAARSFKPSLCLLGVVTVDILCLLGEEQEMESEPAASVGAAGDPAIAGGLRPSASLLLAMLASSETLRTSEISVISACWSPPSQQRRTSSSARDSTGGRRSNRCSWWSLTWCSAAASDLATGL